MSSRDFGSFLKFAPTSSFPSFSLGTPLSVQAPLGHRLHPPDSFAKILAPCSGLALLPAKRPGTLRHKTQHQAIASGTAVNSQRHKSEIKRYTTGIKRSVAGSNRNIIDLLRHGCRDFSPNRHKKAFHKGDSCQKISAEMLSYCLFYYFYVNQHISSNLLKIHGYSPHFP